MKITDSKGNKKDISSFFYSKSKEILFKRIYYLFSILLFFLIFVISILLFSLVPYIIISFILVLTLVAFCILFIQEYLANVVFYIMKLKEDRETDLRVQKNRKYKDIQSSKHKHSIFNNSKFIPKRNLFKSFNFNNNGNKSIKKKSKSYSNEEKYIEIR